MLFLISNAFFQLSLSVAQFFNNQSLKYCLTVAYYIKTLLLRQAMFSIFVSVCVLAYICLIYLICFPIIIFIFLSINHIISLIQTTLFVGHVCQKFSLRVLLSFGLIFCQFLPKVLFIKKVCNQTSFLYRNYFSTFVLRQDVFKLNKNIFKKIKKQN